jgi:hypothetical protein
MQLHVSLGDDLVRTWFIASSDNNATIQQCENLMEYGKMKLPIFGGSLAGFDSTVCLKSLP